MRYFMRPEMRENIDRIHIIEEEPETERRPDMARAWAEVMNDYREIDRD